MLSKGGRGRELQNDRLTFSELIKFKFVVGFFIVRNECLAFLKKIIDRCSPAKGLSNLKMNIRLNDALHVKIDIVELIKMTIAPIKYSEGS